MTITSVHETDQQFLIETYDMFSKALGFDDRCNLNSNDTLNLVPLESRTLEEESDDYHDLLVSLGESLLDDEETTLVTASGETAVTARDNRSAPSNIVVPVSELPTVPLPYIAPTIVGSQRSQQQVRKSRCDEEESTFETNHVQQNQQRQTATTGKKRSCRSQEEEKEEALQPPKRALTAYNLFFKHERQMIQQERKEQQDFRKQNSVTFEQLGKLIGRRWRTLEPERKRYFEDLAERDDLRYHKEMMNYQRRKQEQRQHKRATKKTCTTTTLAATSSPPEPHMQLWEPPAASMSSSPPQSYEIVMLTDMGYQRYRVNSYQCFRMKRVQVNEFLKTHPYIIEDSVKKPPDETANEKTTHSIGV